MRGLVRGGEGRSTDVSFQLKFWPFDYKILTIKLICSFLIQNLTEKAHIT